MGAYVRKYWLAYPDVMWREAIREKTEMKLTYVDCVFKNYRWVIIPFFPRQKLENSL